MATSGYQSVDHSRIAQALARWIDQASWNFAPLLHLRVRLQRPPVAVSMGESGVRGGRPRSIDEQIELSKSHWSQLADSVCSSTYDEVAADNLAAFEELQRHPSWCHFFKTFGYDTEVWDSSGTMEVGEKFAEGGQAELFPRG